MSASLTVNSDKFSKISHIVLVFHLSTLNKQMSAWLFVLVVTQPTITCLKLRIKTLEQGFFIVKFEHISHLVLVFLLLTCFSLYQIRQRVSIILCFTTLLR